MVITGRESYEWLIPVGTFGQSHAFCLGARMSLCVRVEREVVPEPTWKRELLTRGEPQRARCHRCAALIAKFPGMSEVTS